MAVCVIDPYSSPVELWETREPTRQECSEMIKQRVWKPCVSIKVRIDRIIRSPLDAAMFFASNQHDLRHDSHVRNYLDESDEYAKWLSFMPGVVPEELLSYQESYPPPDFDKVNEAVNVFGIIMPDEQFLFHGGGWPRDKDGNHVTTLITDRVLSTSLCPKVAINNAEWRGKAWVSNRLDLMVIKIKNSTTKSFVFDKDLPAQGHELEVLFAKGATLNFISEKEIAGGRVVNKYQQRPKRVKIFIISIELS